MFALDHRYHTEPAARPTPSWLHWAIGWTSRSPKPRDQRFPQPQVVCTVVCTAVRRTHARTEEPCHALPCCNCNACHSAPVRARREHVPYQKHESRSCSELATSACLVICYCVPATASLHEPFISASEHALIRSRDSRTLEPTELPRRPGTACNGQPLTPSLLYPHTSN